VQAKGAKAMMKADEQKDMCGMFGCCGPAMRKGGRSCGIWWGIMLILIGFFWLTSEMGLFDPELFWPVVFLAAGVSVLALTLAGKQRFRMNYRQNTEENNERRK
jgi:hypothetical protein